MLAASIELAGGTGGGAAAAAACDPGHWPLARDREPRLRQPPCCPFLFHSIKCGRWTKRHHSGEPFLGRLQSEWERACAAAGGPAGRKALWHPQESVHRAAMKKVERHVRNLGADAP